MNPGIRKALDNIEGHESKATAFIKSAAAAKKFVIPLGLTALGLGLGHAGAEMLSPVVDVIKETVENGSLLLSAKPKIFYGIVSGLVAGGVLLAGVGYLEKRDEKKASRLSLKDASKNFQDAWEEIVKTNSSITEKVARQQAWAHRAISSNPDTNGILRKHGLDPQNKSALIDLQKAYIHGVKLAFVIAKEDGRHAQISGASFDQYTNKNIMRGMVSYYQDLGYSVEPGKDKSSDAYEIVSRGYGAIRALRDHELNGPGTSRRVDGSSRDFSR